LIEKSRKKRRGTRFKKNFSKRREGGGTIIAIKDKRCGRRGGQGKRIGRGGEEVSAKEIFSRKKGAR